MRRGMITLVLFSVFFMLAVWGGTSLLSGITAPEPVARDLTTEFMTLHRAFNGPGVTPFQSPHREALVQWLVENVGEHARVPNLEQAGLVASGVRALQSGGGGLGMVRYRDMEGAAGDVIAVFAPRRRVGVPDKAEQHEVMGKPVWLQTENTARLVYAVGPEVDWVLVSARSEEGLLAAASALIRYEFGPWPSSTIDGE